MLFNWMKQDKTCKFLKKSSFSSYIQQYNRKQLNQLILCQFDARRLVIGKDRRQLNQLILCQFDTKRLAGEKGIVVHSLKKRTSSKICTFCPVSSNQKAFFNLLCVLDLFSVNSVSDFFFFLNLKPNDS